MARKVSLALARALKTLPLQPEDAAAVELARVYARELDKREDLVTVYGRGFRETLETLGMTPKARAAITKGDRPATPKSTPMDELRQRRERRA